MVYKKQGFIKGVFVLTAAGIFSRFLGFFYRILLPRLIGAEAVGLYQYVYPIYTTILVVSQSGIPIAISKLVSEKMAQEKQADAFRVFSLARRMSIALGLLFSLVLFFLARPLTSYLDPLIYPAVLAITPAIFFVSIMATYRGFFQGLQTMLPTAYSQATEQLIRMITILSLSYLLLPWGIEWAAAGATFGAVTGSIVGLSLLLYLYWKKRQEISDFKLKNAHRNLPAKKVYQRLFSLALPVTFGALVLPLMEFVDVMVVPRRLQSIGYDLSSAREVYAMFTGMAMVLVHFPTMFTVSLGATLVPSISEAYTRDRLAMIRQRTNTSFRMVTIITLPAAVGLFLLAEPICTVVFGEPGAAIPLRVVTWGIIFIGFQQTTTAILQGMGMVMEPARNLLLGAVLNAALNYLLTGIPALGIRGAAFSTVSGFFVAGLLNLVYLHRRIDLRLDLKSILYSPLLGILLMGLFLLLGFSYLQSFFALLLGFLASIMEGIWVSGSLFLVSRMDFIVLTLSTLMAVLLGALIYAVSLLWNGGLKEKEIMMIPGVGNHLNRILKKMKGS